MTVKLRTVHLAVVGCSVSCGGLSGMTKPPTADLTGQAASQAAVDPNRPLVVDWPASARVQLSSLSKVALTQRKLLVVHYAGDSIAVLPYCGAVGVYAYDAADGATPEKDVIKDSIALQASLPFTAAKVGGRLQSGQALVVDASVVGELRANKGAFAPTDLDGGPDCGRATHVVTALSLGAFRLDSSATNAAEVQGGGGSVGASGAAEASNQRINFGGDLSKCGAATGHDSQPPDGCASPVGVELRPIGPGAAVVTVSAPDKVRADVERRVAAVLPTNPLLVEWPSADRAELELLMRKQLVAIHLSPGQINVLTRCTLPGHYDYVAATRREDHMVFRDPDELYANVPAGAALLIPVMQRQGQLSVDLVVVGRYLATGASQQSLTGDCDGVTHYIRGVSVGAWRFAAGNMLLATQGDSTACSNAAAGDATPPARCGALLKLDLAPL